MRRALERAAAMIRRGLRRTRRPSPVLHQQHDDVEPPPSTPCRQAAEEPSAGRRLLYGSRVVT